jgi:hypothetical protein
MDGGIKMKALQNYVRQANDWNAIFNRGQYDIGNESDRQALARRIDNELSPENLSCDGELSRSEVNRRYNNLIRVAEQLQKLDPTIQFLEV